MENPYNDSLANTKQVSNPYGDLESGTVIDEQKSGTLLDAGIDNVLSNMSPVEDQEVVGENSSTEWGEVFKSAVTNLVPSAKSLGVDTFNSLIHPVQTLENMAKIGVGGVQKLIPGEQKQEKNFDMLTDFMIDRYGSIDGVKKTIANDPAGLMADAVGFLIPGGAAIKGVGSATKVASLIKAGKIAQKAGSILDPFTIGKKALLSPRHLIPKGAPSALYKSALKFSSSIPEWKVDKLVATALAQEVIPSSNSLAKLRAKINVTNKEVSDIIDLADKKGEKISTVKFMDKMGEIVDSVEDSATNKAMNKTLTDFYAHQDIKRGAPRDWMTPNEAQKVKQNLYKELNNAYSKLTLNPIKARTKMALANGIKSNLEKAVMDATGGDIKMLNRFEGELIDLKKAIDARVGTINNADVLPFNTVGRSLVGGIAGGPAGAFAGLGLGVMSWPRVQSKLAILMNNMKKANITIPPKTVLARLAAIAPERVGMNKQGENNE